ncbi:hypothetical protein [Breznakiella homolactica]|uniref:Uncharacterized protein n=1 Tax=Breznakiella homolactica TaxID=2798577 RepID=A0A7T8BBZ7_9SPIR|nr:hypothetical protein [Breznakiella homolactica]QQO10896.1 hypothetical protein JFL75_08260 [Breznakiella homolactica]
MRFKLCCFILFIFFLEASFALNVNLDSGIILKGYFKDINAENNIHFTIEYPECLYINNSDESLKTFKIICNDWDKYIKYYKQEERIESILEYPFFVAGKFVLEDPENHKSEIKLEIFTMVLEYYETDVPEYGLDFLNIFEYVYYDFLTEGELFYIEKPYPGFYMEIYGKFIGIEANQFLEKNLVKVFENDLAATINGNFTIQWRGNGNGIIGSRRCRYTIFMITDLVE